MTKSTTTRTRARQAAEQYEAQQTAADEQLSGEPIRQTESQSLEETASGSGSLPENGAPAETQEAEVAEEDVTQLRQDLQSEKAKAADYLAQWQRTAADFANFKRRVEQERADMAKLFNASLVSQLLPVLDNFERALAAVPPEFAEHGWIEGVTLTEKQLRAALEKEGLTPIHALGQKFDPNLHEAVAHEASDSHEEDTVIEEFQRGYKLHDRVIRPSMVKVSRRN